MSEIPATIRPFNVVYHIAAMNDWRRVVSEQISILLRNRNIASLQLTIGADLASEWSAAVQHVTDTVRETGKAIPTQARLCHLDQFEHPAMILLDDVARGSDLPVLYFHTKGVSQNPPELLYENWRHYLNDFVGEADKWADFLWNSDYDACGRFQTFDKSHGYTYFAGNFWMARSVYLRSLPPYLDFLQPPKASDFRGFDRHRAEVAVNRARRMKPYATDGMVLTPMEVKRFLQDIPG
jgi:hypothetical protein